MKKETSPSSCNHFASEENFLVKFNCLNLSRETLFQISMIICPSVTAEEQEIVIIINFLSLIVKQTSLKIHFGIDI